MNTPQFQSEMLRAQAMQRLSVDPGRVEYYAGYLRGLRRSFHGDAFGTLAEHELWLSLAADEDESRKQRGIGYSDGLKFGK